MATGTFTWKLTINIDGTDVVATNPATAPTFTATLKDDRTISVADTTTARLWTAQPLATVAGQTLSDFDVLLVQSDKDVFLELTCNEGDAAETLSVVPLKAAFPFVLFRDDSFYNYTVTDAFGGTLDVIDKIKVRNQSGATATIRVLLLT